MKTMQALCLGFGLLAGAAHGQPTINFVTNAASYIHPPLHNSSIAQGEFFTVLLAGAAPLTAIDSWNVYPHPTSIDGTSVTVTVSASSLPAYIYYVGPSWVSSIWQVDVVMPSGTPIGPGTIVVTQNGASSLPYPIVVAASSAGSYSLNGAGSGPGLFYNIAGDGSATQNNLFQTAKPGQIVELHGTGLGPSANPALEDDQPPTQVDVRSPDFLVDVWVGNQQATVQYAGRSSYTAEDLIAFSVPGGVSGCYNEVAVYAGPPGYQTVGNFTSLAVDPNGAPCQDADGINMNDLAPAIESKGSASVGAFSLLSNYNLLSIALIGNLQWDEDTVNAEVATLSAQQLNASFGYTTLPSVNNCASYTYLQYPPPIDPVLGGAFGPPDYLDAGANLNIHGPNGAQPVPKNSNGDDYSALVGGTTIAGLLTGGGLPPYFLSDQGWGGPSWIYAVLPGAYTLTGAGGSDVGAFSASVAVSSSAAAFKWTNQAITSNPISRDIPLTLTWTGGDPDGFVLIVASGTTAQSGFTPPPTTPGVLVECVAPASTGAFTIPVYVLQSLPSTWASTATIPPGSLMVGPASGAVKLNPTPSGLDAAYIFYHYAAGVNVAWQ